MTEILSVGLQKTDKGLKVPIKRNFTKFWVVVLLSHMNNHLIPRRIQFTASQHLFSFRSYKGLKMAKSARPAEFVTSYD